MARRPLHSIFVDIDDTVYSTTKFTSQARRNAIDAMCRAGLRIAPEQVRELLDDIVLELSSNSDHHYDALLERVGPDAFSPSNPAVIVAAGVAAYHDTKIRDLAPYEDAVKVLRELSRTSIQLGVITAGRAVKQAEKLVRLGIVSFFEPKAIFITSQMGLEKDDPELYARICRSLSLDPERCMLVGDNPRVDVDTPHEAGWITVHARRSGGRHVDVPSKHDPDYVIHNFFDLREVLNRDFEF